MSSGLLKLVPPIYVDAISRVWIVAASFKDDQLLVKIGIDPNLLSSCTTS